MARRGSEGDWFDDNDDGSGGGSDGAGGAGSSEFGHPVYDRIAAIWRQAVGRTPTLAEVSAWGTNVDDRYLTAIRQHIFGLPEAATYRQRQAGGGGGTTPAPAPGPVTLEDIKRRLLSRNRETIIQALRDLAQLRGVPVRESSYDTWANYILNGNGETFDPEYFANRVINDDYEFRGLPDPGHMGGDGSGKFIKPWEREIEIEKFKPPPAFEAPDPNKLFDDPNFKFRMGEGVKALERSAAARGTLLTGGSMKDIGSWVSDFTGNEYDRLYDRAVNQDQMRYSRSLGEYDIGRQNALTKYETARENFWANQDRPWGKWMDLTRLGLDAYGRATSATAPLTARGWPGASQPLSQGGAAASAPLVNSDNGAGGGGNNALTQWQAARRRTELGY